MKQSQNTFYIRCQLLYISAPGWFFPCERNTRWWGLFIPTYHV